MNHIQFSTIENISKFPIHVTIVSDTDSVFPRQKITYDSVTQMLRCLMIWAFFIFNSPEVSREK